MSRMLYDVLLCLIISVISLDMVNAQTWSDDEEDKDSDLRSMLMTVREQNRRLVLQNDRLQKIWLGMQQMCSALEMEKCECEDRDKNVETERKVKEDLKPVQFTFVESSGLETANGNVTIRVGYTAPREHTHEWLYTRIEGFTTRTLGRNMTDSYGHNYSFEVTVESPETLSYFIFRVTTERKYQDITINLTAIETQQTQYLSEPTPDYLNFEQVFEAPQDTDLVITTIINKTLSSLERDTEGGDISFEGINTTTNPPTGFSHFINDPKLSLDSESVRLTITIPYSEVQFGGYLVVSLRYKPQSTGLIKRVTRGIVVQILPYGSKTVVPENTVGLFPVKKQHIIGEKSQSLFCSAIGNPRPQVSIMKVSKSGKTKMLESETVFESHTMHVTSFTFKHDPMTNNMEGHFLCRATSGNRTIDEETELVQLHPAVFDESKTGIIKNTTRSVGVSCKASGTPRPELEMCLYENFGPDLLTRKSNGLYEVKRKNSKKSSRVVLTVFPNEAHPLASFHTFTCVAKQDGVSQIRTIEMFPGVNGTQLTWDWDLIDQLNGA